MSVPERLGYEAYMAGRDRDVNPWQSDEYRDLWFKGWDKAEREVIDTVPLSDLAIVTGNPVA